jgi:RimJ/RimL family protein N-acetyltransferase
MHPTLAETRVLLRPLAWDDRDALYAAVDESREALGAWMSWCNPAYSVRDAGEWIDRCERSWESQGDREFGIFDAASGEVLGCTGINQFNRINNFANLGYWVRTSRAGQGIASAAALLLAKWAFRELKINRIEIVALAGNAASRRVAEKIGCRFEGIARNRLVFRGLPHDGALYSLVPRDVDA